MPCNNYVWKTSKKDSIVQFTFCCVPVLSLTLLIDLKKIVELMLIVLGGNVNMFDVNLCF